jgi:feruloyl esterase
VPQRTAPGAKPCLICAGASAACDAIDGVTDVVHACIAAHSNVASLQSKGTDDGNFLMAPQVQAAQKIYQGPTNPRTGAQIYPGQVVGSETGWPSYWGSTDLAQFKARGAKLLVYQGWNDPVVVATDTIAYYDKVKAVQGSQEQMDGFFRMFLVPGMGHCSGGAGATSFGNAGLPPVVDADHDLLSALDRWVEKGAAPERIVASRVVNGEVTRTRPICAYPAKAVYSGTGSTDSAANFSCR